MMKRIMEQKRALSFLVMLALVMTMIPAFPMTVSALSSGNSIDVSDTNTTSGPGWKYESSTGEFTITGDAIISGTTDVNRIVVSTSGTINITLSSVNVDVSGTLDACAFEVTGGATEVNLWLSGPSILESGSGRAGLEAAFNSCDFLIIYTSSGSLRAEGGQYGAGIGGGDGQGSSGNIIIDPDSNMTSNTITAYGGLGAAGIGGGRGGGSGSVIFEDVGGSGSGVSTIRATGGPGGAGIGSGVGVDAGETIIRTSCIVDARGGDSYSQGATVYGAGAGIGGGGGISGGAGSGGAAGLNVEDGFIATVSAIGGNGYGEGHAGAGAGSGGAAGNGAVGDCPGFEVTSSSITNFVHGLGFDGARQGYPLGTGGSISTNAPNFIAQNSVNLQSPTSLVIQNRIPQLVQGFSLYELFPQQRGATPFTIEIRVGIPTNQGIAYDDSAGVLTLLPQAFGLHGTQSGNPLTAGDYIMVIMLDAGNSVYYGYPVRITLTSGGPGGGGGGATGNESAERFIICNTIRIPYTMSQDTINANVDGATLKNIVEKANVDSDGSRIINIDFSGVSGAAGLNFTLDSADIGDYEDITFIIKTPFGEFIFTKKQMQEWFADDDEPGKYTFTLEKSSLKVDVKKDGESASWDSLLPMARMAVAYSLKADENPAYAVSTDKNRRVLPTSVYEKGMVYADIFFAAATYGAGIVIPTSFTDTDGHWAEDFIGYVTIRQLISGTSGSTFSPNKAITRADYLMALGKLSGADVSEYTSSTYSDVDNESEAMPYIQWATENMIVQGVGGGRFAPEKSITRQEMAVMMVQYAGSLGYELPDLRDAESYADEKDISSWAKGAVRDLRHTGIMDGKPENVFDPKGNTTRAEASSILEHFIEIVISSDHAKGWSNDNNYISKIIYYDQNANRLTGWQEIEENTYYFDADGIMCKGWQEIEESKYYFGTDGVMSTGWQMIEEDWYYLDEDGKLVVNSTVDGYQVDENGARIEEE